MTPRLQTDKKHGQCDTYCTVQWSLKAENFSLIRFWHQSLRSQGKGFYLEPPSCTNGQQ